jgi:hypothetical protein
LSCDINDDDDESDDNEIDDDRREIKAFVLRGKNWWFKSDAFK